jgi:hypothetical protein
VGLDSREGLASCSFVNAQDAECELEICREKKGFEREGICTESFLIVHLIHPVLVRILARELGIDRMLGHLGGCFLATLLRRIASR